MTYYYNHNGKDVSFFIDAEKQFAALVNKGSKWVDMECQEGAWQVLSPNAFKIYNKYSRQLNNYVWVYNRDIFGMSDESFTAAVDELVRKGFLAQMHMTDKETGEVVEVPSVYNFYERPRA